MSSRRARQRAIFVGSSLALVVACLTFAGTWLFVEAADRECLDRSAQLAPADVLFLNERTSLLVKGEQTLLPLGIRCAWPTTHGTQWSNDGWRATLVAYGSLATAVTGYLILLCPDKSDSEPQRPLFR